MISHADSFFGWQKRILKKVDPEQVICLIQDKNYTHIFLPDKVEYEVRSSLTSALKKLPPGMFIQISRTTVVSILYSDKIARDHLVLDGATEPIGKLYYAQLLKKLNIIE